MTWRAISARPSKWALYVSPMAWAIEQIVTGIYGNDPQLVELYGYDSSEKQTGIAFAALATVGPRELNLIETRVASA